jgi:hypothetical protein
LDYACFLCSIDYFLPDWRFDDCRLKRVGCKLLKAKLGLSIFLLFYLYSATQYLGIRKGGFAQIIFIVGRNRKERGVNTAYSGGIGDILVSAQVTFNQNGLSNQPFNFYLHGGKGNTTFNHMVYIAMLPEFYTTQIEKGRTGFCQPPFYNKTFQTVRREKGRTQTVRPVFLTDKFNVVFITLTPFLFYQR